MAEEESLAGLKTALDAQLVLIPSGTVDLRNHRKNEIRTVSVNSLRVAKYPVTQEMYYAVTQSRPSVFRGERCPVENVSWFDAIEFCNRLSKLMDLKPCYSVHDEGADFDDAANGYRLPFEAEWEHACRADTRAVVYGDLYDPEVYGSYRVVRGGGWNDPARGCLASNRRKSHPSYKVDDLGFRLARSL